MIELTPIQLKFVKAIMEAIQKDKDLIQFIHAKGSGKTTALKFIDNEFDFMGYPLNQKKNQK
jgi:ABC-type proline/glycine betaine transport system ATPase subunit